MGPVDLQPGCDCVHGLCDVEPGQCVCLHLWIGPTCNDDAIVWHPTALAARIWAAVFFFFTLTYIIRKLVLAAIQRKGKSAITFLLIWSGISVASHIAFKVTALPLFVPSFLLASIAGVVMKVMMFVMIGYVRKVRRTQRQQLRAVAMISSAALLVAISIIVAAPLAFAYQSALVFEFVDTCILSPIILAQAWRTRVWLQQSSVQDRNMQHRCTLLIRALAIVTFGTMALFVIRAALGDSLSAQSVGLGYVPVFIWFGVVPLMMFWVQIAFWSDSGSVTHLTREHVVFLFTCGCKTIRDTTPHSISTRHPTSIKPSGISPIAGSEHYINLSDDAVIQAIDLDSPGSAAGADKPSHPARAWAKLARTGDAGTDAVSSSYCPSDDVASP